VGPPGSRRITVLCTDEVCSTNLSFNLPSTTRARLESQNVASTAFLKRAAAEARREETIAWIRSRTAKSRAYIPPRTLRFREKLRNEKKEVASRYYQFLTGHALTAPYLKEKLKTRDSDECWWCESGKRQTREHLFKECPRWLPEIRELWRAVGKALGWKRMRWRSVSALFREERATEAILEFLRQTEIGKMRRVEVPVDGEAGGPDEE
jgi:hypothetical protein